MTSINTGLTDAEVRLRILKFGYNEISRRKFLAAFETVVTILKDPMGMMLLVLGIIYWSLGEHRDAVILLIAYVPVIGVDVVLELRSRKALRALKRSLKSTCTVIRNSEKVVVSTRDLVPGDILVLEEGQTIPADGKLLEGSNLTIDEASLTGESLPVEKQPGSDILSGTTILAGTGIIEIEKTGPSSQVGSIATVLENFESSRSPLLDNVNRFVKKLFFGALAIAIVIFFAGIYKSLDISHSLIAALTLAMAAIPEEFPFVFTLYLSMAAFRLSKAGMLVKTLPAVEGLGRVDVLCIDKTGTLTEGRFVLENILSPSGRPQLEDREALGLLLSCEKRPIDPMESAILVWLDKARGRDFSTQSQQRWSLEVDYPFNPDQKYMSHIWKESGSENRLIAMKGAVEGVLSHCDLPAIQKENLILLANGQAQRGQRLLGLAMGRGPFTKDRDVNETDLEFVGILCFADPVRPGVANAIRDCISQGISIKMLTGDHLLTAHSIADKIGLPHEHDQLFSGPQLNEMDVESRTNAFRRGAIFARLKPDQKLEMIKAIKADGKIVAMTGDGINDAPALKLADVSISMGERATDIARSTAQLVLMKNEFSSIVAAIFEGRRVLQSLSQSFGYLIAFHIPIVGIAFFQALFLKNQVLLPIHIILMELIVHPVSAFVFDESNASSGNRLKTLISRPAIIWSSVRGTLVTLLCLSSLLIFSNSQNQERTFVVLILIAGNIGLIVAERGGVLAVLKSVSGFRRTWIAGLMLIFLATLLAYVAPLTRLFSLTAPTFQEFLFIIGVGIIVGVVGPCRDIRITPRP